MWVRVRRVAVTIALLIIGVVGFHVAIGTPINMPPTHISVHGLFPDDLLQFANNPDDHGWWFYTMRSDSSADPEALCEEILAEMNKRWPLTFPGIGVSLAKHGTASPQGHCGHPEWLVQDPGAAP